MARKKIGLKNAFERGKFGGKVATAASNQVRIDFRLDQLNQRHQEGEISDQQLLKGMEQLRENIKVGTGLRRQVRSEQVGAAQEIATGIREGAGEAQTEFLDEAQRRWNNATNLFSQGQMSQAEYSEEKELYQAAIEGTRELPKQKKTVRQVLSGKAFDRYKSGRMRSIVREQQIKKISQEEGAELSRQEIRREAGSEGALPFIRKKIQTDKPQARDLGKEQACVASLRADLGRLPTPQEINECAYGA